MANSLVISGRRKPVNLEAEAALHPCPLGRLRLASFHVLEFLLFCDKGAFENDLVSLTNGETDVQNLSTPGISCAQH